MEAPQPQEEAWSILKNGLVIYLRCAPKELFRRLKKDIKRPILKNVAVHERYQYIIRLLKKREPFYLRADLIVDSVEQHTKDETANIISQLIKDKI